MRSCVICGREIDSRRKRCNSCNTKIRRVRCKIAAIKYLGGKCTKCGYDKSITALEFHHVNPKEKEFSIGGVANRKWELVKAELDKCILLCANCHRIEHSTRDDELLLQEVLNYNGRELEGALA